MRGMGTTRGRGDDGIPPCFHPCEHGNNNSVQSSLTYTLFSPMQRMGTTWYVLRCFLFTHVQTPMGRTLDSAESGCPSPFHPWEERLAASRIAPLSVFRIFGTWQSMAGFASSVRRLLLRYQNEESLASSATSHLGYQPGALAATCCSHAEARVKKKA